MSKIERKENNKRGERIRLFDRKIQFSFFIKIVLNVRNIGYYFFHVNDLRIIIRLNPFNNLD